MPREIDALGTRDHSNKLKVVVSTCKESSLEELVPDFESELEAELELVACPLLF